MAKPRTPRTRWIDAGLDALARGGPDAVRIESLAQALGVTKGGFYWFFENRGALLHELLDTWEHTLVDRVIERVESDGGDAHSKLRRLFALAGSGETRSLLRAELAIREWARHDDGVGQRLRRVDNRRMDYMRALYAPLCRDPGDVEARCLTSMALFIGSHFIEADHGDRSRDDVMHDALEHLLVAARPR
ncbi:MAG TPA: TetR/AcrR family transcriptional regulator [Solirubrobacteraceae bacterium]|nr:TetR/AcrR family transcriptional regulator [Solirubrobacteraceae bacterium]